MLCGFVLTKQSKRRTPPTVLGESYTARGIHNGIWKLLVYANLEVNPMFLDDKDFAQLARKIDHRYCNAAISANLDPDVSALLEHAIDANASLQVEEDGHSETRETLERLRELVRDIALQMERKGTFDNWVDRDHADDLCNFAKQLKDAMKVPEPSL
jgi:hypothetical protein